MFKFKVALAAVALIALGAAFCGPAQARKAWFGPGSGPISPYANYKGFAQVPRQAGGSGMFGVRKSYTQPYSGDVSLRAQCRPRRRQWNLPGLGDGSRAPEPMVRRRLVNLFERPPCKANSAPR